MPLGYRITCYKQGSGDDMLETNGQGTLDGNSDGMEDLGSYPRQVFRIDKLHYKDQ
jgi:hypothetical protein